MIRDFPTLFIPLASLGHPGRGVFRMGGSGIVGCKDTMLCSWVQTRRFWQPNASCVWAVAKIDLKVHALTSSRHCTSQLKRASTCEFLIGRLPVS